MIHKEKVHIEVHAVELWLMIHGVKFEWTSDCRHVDRV